MQKRIVVQRVTIPNATAANSITKKDLPLDINFKKCTGYAMIEVNNTGNTKYDVLLRENAGVFQDSVISEHLKTSTAVPHKERLIKVDFPSSGNTVSIELKNQSATTAVVDVDFIFQLEN